MSTILIDRHTAALLGELAATPVPARSLDLTAVDGVALGVASGHRATGVRRGAAGATAVPSAPTRRPPRREAEIAVAEGVVTERRPVTAEVRLRRRLRCGPRVGRGGRTRAAVVATERGRPATQGSGSLHLTRRGRVVALLLLFVVLTATFSVGRVTSTALGAAGGSSAEVVVQPGDTLWSIAERIAPDTDPRSTAADLMAVNGLGSPSLDVGQHLRLP